MFILVNILLCCLSFNLFVYCIFMLFYLFFVLVLEGIIDKGGIGMKVVRSGWNKYGVVIE